MSPIPSGSQADAVKFLLPRDNAAPILPAMSVVAVTARSRGQLISELDGRYGAMNPGM